MSPMAKNKRSAFKEYAPPPFAKHGASQHHARAFILKLCICKIRCKDSGLPHIHKIFLYFLLYKIHKSSLLYYLSHYLISWLFFFFCFVCKFAMPSAFV